MAFEQATIKVEKEKEFGELKAAISRAFAPENVEKYLKKMASSGLRIRDFDSVLAKRVLGTGRSVVRIGEGFVFGFDFDRPGPDERVLSFED